MNELGTLTKDFIGAHFDRFSRRIYCCFCGKYRRKIYEYIVCDECGVEVQPLYLMVRSVIEADNQRNRELE